MNYQTIAREELKVGDEVQIANGDWFKVKKVEQNYVITSNDHAFHFLTGLITGFRRKVEAFKNEEWLGYSHIKSKRSLSETIWHNTAEQHLQETYGSPPIVRVYNGEPAEQFNIKKDTAILVWNSACWEFTVFNLLQIGDRWMKQPPPPK